MALDPEGTPRVARGARGARENFAGAGRGSWAYQICSTEKLILDGYSEFCLKT